LKTPSLITEKYLRNNKNKIFVFGDNLDRKGKGGAAKLRDEKNTYGFITKKHPRSNDSDFYTPDEYKEVYNLEIIKLKKEISANPEKTYLISNIGGGLANRFDIKKEVIDKNLKKDLNKFNNIEFLEE